MSFPYYRFFVGDYDRDTRHLSMLQHGAYRLLIDAYMAHGPLPNDLNRLYRTCGAFNAEERSAIELVLGEFFRLEGPVWRHKRCDAEILWQTAKHESSLKANAMRWQSERISEWTPNQIQNQIHKPEPNTETEKPKVKTLLYESEKRILTFLNETAGKRFRDTKTNLTFIKARLDDGITEDQLRKIIVRKCREWLPDDKMRDYLQPKTLFNRTNCENYVGNLVPASEVKREFE